MAAWGDSAQACSLRSRSRATKPPSASNSQNSGRSLTHENAVLKRLKFAAQSERYSPEQRSLLEESLDADLQAVAEELEALTPPTPERQAKQQPKRRPLPAHLPRREIRHDPESTTCACGCQMKRIGDGHCDLHTNAPPHGNAATAHLIPTPDRPSGLAKVWRAHPCTVPPATMNWPPATWCSVRSSSGASSKCQRPWRNTRSSAQAASTSPMKRS